MNTCPKCDNYMYGKHRCIPYSIRQRLPDGTLSESQCFYGTTYREAVDRYCFKKLQEIAATKPWRPGGIDYGDSVELELVVNDKWTLQVRSGIRHVTDVRRVTK